jgi:hypothetical protein
MKQMLIIAGFVLLGFLCCKKTEETPVIKNVVLQGIDLSLSPCSGGIITKIDSSTNYRVDSMPGISRADLYRLPFPKNVQLEYVTDRTCGGITYLKVLSFRF